jgi:hypothetical protein
VVLQQFTTIYPTLFYIYFVFPSTNKNIFVTIRKLGILIEAFFKKKEIYACCCDIMPL